MDRGSEKGSLSEGEWYRPPVRGGGGYSFEVLNHKIVNDRGKRMSKVCEDVKTDENQNHLE